MNVQIFDFVLKCMSEVGELVKLSGEEKKQVVLTKVRQKIQLNDVREEMIVRLIDTLISVEKGQLAFNKDFCCKCF